MYHKGTGEYVNAHTVYRDIVRKVKPIAPQLIDEGFTLNPALFKNLALHAGVDVRRDYEVLVEVMTTGWWVTTRGHGYVGGNIFDPCHHHYPLATSALKAAYELTNDVMVRPYWCWRLSKDFSPIDRCTVRVVFEWEEELTS
jgi:hypothetical protein